MKKVLDFLLIFFLIFFTFQFFSSSKETRVVSGIDLSPSSSSYTIPATVFLNITNNTSENLSFDGCSALSINYAGSKVPLPEGYCGDIALAPSESAKLDYSELHDLFGEPGNYVFELEIDDKKYISQIEVAHRGTIGKIFVGLFFAPIFNATAYLIQLFSYSLGWGIICITILIRILLLYPQHKMMVSQRKLQKIQPKIKKIQEQHKGDQQKLGLELMALYKKEKVNPLGSCGFLIIQMPILLVIYNIILNIQDPSNAFHLYGFLQHFEISQISQYFYGIDLLAAGGITGAILAITIAIIQYIQIKLSLANNQANASDKK